jgi:hypothetical protein
MLDALYGRITWIAARRAMAAEILKTASTPLDSLIDLDPYPAAIGHPCRRARRQLDLVRYHYAADTWPGKSRPRARCPLQ